ncbi:MAG TPA: hypothetical protein VFH50_15275 [Acidimicrobiales bacterium]|nr:hypothetical protein [Acidimicrobiales bacterium]
MTRNRNRLQHLPVDLRDSHLAEDPRWWAVRQPARQAAAPTLEPSTQAAALDAAPDVGSGD